MALPEIQCSTGTDAKQPAAVQKSAGGKKEPLAFKKKLEDSLSADETPYGASAAAEAQNETGSQDNSMAANLTEKETQIVGILEGFGMLDNLSDLPLSTSQNGVNTDGTDAAQKLLALLQELTQSAEQTGSEQTGALEKYARMLSKDQLTKLPEDMKQAVFKAVGDYLGSFESTNNKPVQTVKDSAAVTADAGDPAGTAADITAMADKIAGLLIKLKTERQGAKPADAGIGPIKTENTEPSVPTEKLNETPSEMKSAQPETPISAQAESRPMADKLPAEDQTFAPQQPKPEAQSAPSAVQRADTPGVQPAPAVQNDENGAQPAAKTPQTSGFVEDNVMRIVDKMSSQVSGGKYDFDVDLKPDFLGKVSIRLSMQNGEIRMQIKTDDLSVKSMFADQISSMQTALKDKGLAVTNIDVTYQSQMQTGAEQKSYSQNGNGRKQNGRNASALERITGIGSFDAVSAINGYIHSGSSVEYLA